MSQTFLGLLGILLVSVLSLRQDQSGMTTGAALRAAEVQALAAQVGAARLEEFATLPFDEAVKEDPATSTVDLTPKVGGAFVRTGPDPGGDDLDDVHGLAETTSHVVRDGESGFDLRTEAQVEYVAEADGVTPSLTPTRFKRVTVTVSPIDVEADDVVLTQLYSCGSFCAW